MLAGGWGWGTSLLDYDNDGDLDFVMTNGYSTPGDTFYDEWTHWPLFLWNNRGASNNTAALPGAGAAYTEDVAAASGLASTSMGRGLLHFDYNNDGALDVLVLNHHGKHHLYHNHGSPASNGWVRVRVLHRPLGPKSRPTDSFGARVWLTCGGTTQRVDTGASTHFMGQSERWAHFGLPSGCGKAEASVLVEWRGSHNATARTTAVPANTTLRVVRPDTAGADTVQAFGHTQPCEVAAPVRQQNLRLVPGPAPTYTTCARDADCAGAGRFCATQCFTGGCGKDGGVPVDADGRFCQPCHECHHDVDAVAGDCGTCAARNKGNVLGSNMLKLDPRSVRYEYAASASQARAPITGLFAVDVHCGVGVGAGGAMATTTSTFNISIAVTLNMSHTPLPSAPSSVAGGAGTGGGHAYRGDEGSAPPPRSALRSLDTDTLKYHGFGERKGLQLPRLCPSAFADALNVPRGACHKHKHVEPPAGGPKRCPFSQHFSTRPAGSDLRSARDVSNMVHAAAPPPPPPPSRGGDGGVDGGVDSGGVVGVVHTTPADERGLNELHANFGQFLSHDLSLSTQYTMLDYDMDRASPMHYDTIKFPIHVRNRSGNVLHESEWGVWSLILVAPLVVKPTPHGMAWHRAGGCVCARGCVCVCVCVCARARACGCMCGVEGGWGKASERGPSAMGSTKGRARPPFNRLVLNRTRRFPKHQ